MPICGNGWVRGVKRWENKGFCICICNRKLDNTNMKVKYLRDTHNSYKKNENILGEKYEGRM